MYGAQIEVQETVNKYLNFSQAIFAPPSKWRPWHVPCLPHPRYTTDFNTSKTQVHTIATNQHLHTPLHFRKQVLIEVTSHKHLGLMFYRVLNMGVGRVGQVGQDPPGF